MVNFTEVFIKWSPILLFFFFPFKHKTHAYTLSGSWVAANLTESHLEQETDTVLCSLAIYLFQQAKWVRVFILEAVVFVQTIL